MKITSLVNRDWFHPPQKERWFADTLLFYYVIFFLTLTFVTSGLYNPASQNMRVWDQSKLSAEGEAGGLDLSIELRLPQPSL
jgi:hypothetical protein